MQIIWTFGWAEGALWRCSLLNGIDFDEVGFFFDGFEALSSGNYTSANWITNGLKLKHKLFIANEMTLPPQQK